MLKTLAKIEDQSVNIFIQNCDYLHHNSNSEVYELKEIWHLVFTHSLS